MRIREGEVATGGIGTGFVPIDTERLSELDKSRQRLERDESMKILSDRIAKENFNRRLRETEAKAKRRAFDKKTAPTWSEEFE
jgi:plasmid replication initiation protein